MSKASIFLKKILTLQLTHALFHRCAVPLPRARGRLLCWYVPPEHWSGLILFVDQLPLGRDMCPQELVDAARDGLTEDGGVVEQQPDILIVVEESSLNEDGGHGRAPQHGEVGVDLDAAVGEGLVEAADGAVQGLLHDGREAVAP